MAGAPKVHTGKASSGTSGIARAVGASRTRQRYDVLILGGGPAGCVLAARLSEESERSVCLVEAGPDYVPHGGGRWPPELLDPSVIPETHDWRDDNGTLPWARVIGGCSAHNACGVARGAAPDYDAWGDCGGEGWTWAAMEPCLRRARAAIEARPRAGDEIGAWPATVLEALVEAGLTRLADFDDQTPGTALIANNVVEGARNNVALAYLDPARERANLTVRGDTIVDRVVLDGTRASGAVVCGAGEVEAVHADRVVVAAGSYGSPAILLRSGIGPEAELRVHDIPVLHDLPGVGAKLADHGRAGIGFALRDETVAALRAEDGERTIVAQCMAKWRSSLCGEDPWDVHFGAIVPPDRSHGRITTGLLRPRSRGRVGLRSRDPAHLPRVENDFLSDPDGHDIGVMTEAVEWVRSLVSTSRLSDAITGEIDPGPGVATADHVRANVATYYHPTGTCSLGGVVDAAAAVNGLDSLYVGDASIVPRPVGAGTFLTTIAVAERVAELLPR